MSKLYNFERLIQKYSVDFIIETEGEGGQYIGGKYVPAEAASLQCRGAIVPMSESKVYQSGGTYTAKDRQLFMRQPIRSALTKAKVIYKGNRYNIEQETNFEDYANAYIYLLKWVSTVE